MNIGKTNNLSFGTFALKNIIDYKDMTEEHKQELYKDIKQTEGVKSITKYEIPPSRFSFITHVPDSVVAAQLDSSHRKHIKDDECVISINSGTSNTTFITAQLETENRVANKLEETGYGIEKYNFRQS